MGSGFRATVPAAGPPRQQIPVTRAITVAYGRPRDSRPVPQPVAQRMPAVASFCATAGQVLVDTAILERPVSATLSAAPPASPARPAADDPLRGILLVLVAMASFSVSDAVAKHLSLSLSPVQIAWLRWLGFLLIMAPCIVASRGAVLKSRAPLLQLMRTVGILGSAVFFIAGLGQLPLADAAAIAFVAPLLVTALSIPLLREPVGPRRWAAVIVGLVGVLIVIRPGGGTVGSAAIYPLLSALSWAFGMVFTRKLGGIDGAGTTMSYSALVGFLVLSAAVPFDWKPPALNELGLASLMALASTAGQFLVVTAYRLAKASILAPISYSQLVWSGLLGLFVFGNVPDGWTLCGVAVIIASGIYTAHRERVTARQRS